jgi:hypothetical protein
MYCRTILNLKLKNAALRDSNFVHLQQALCYRINNVTEMNAVNRLNMVMAKARQTGRWSLARTSISLETKNNRNVHPDNWQSS